MLNANTKFVWCVKEKEKKWEADNVIGTIVTEYKPAD